MVADLVRYSCGPWMFTVAGSKASTVPTGLPPWLLSCPTLAGADATGVGAAPIRTNDVATRQLLRWLRRNG